MTRRVFLAVGLLGFALAGPVGAAEDRPVRIVQADDHLDFKAGDELVARYHAGPGVAKPYFWPLNAPGSIPVTRAWPMEKNRPGESTDHVHQKSAWFCHGDVIPEGAPSRLKVLGVEGVDFWAEGPGRGKIVCTRVEPPVNEAGRSRVVTHNEWRDANGARVLDETRTITFRDLGTARLIVVDSDLRPGDKAVTFGDTKEGSFGVRVNDQIAEKGGKGRLENAEGKVGEKEVWGKPSRWCDYSGPIDGKTAGIAILDDPANPSPACWHSRSYGLMAANPFGRKKSGFAGAQDGKDLVKLARGEHLRLRYGLLLHTGDAREGAVEKHYQEFVKAREPGVTPRP